MKEVLAIIRSATIFLILNVRHEVLKSEHRMEMLF